MEKVKDLTKVILPEGGILGEIKRPKRYIIAPDGSKDEDSYVVVIAVHNSVKDIAPGDIIVKYGGSLSAYPYNGDRTIVSAHRGAVIIAVRPDNFIDPDKVTESVNV